MRSRVPEPTKEERLAFLREMSSKPPPEPEPEPEPPPWEFTSLVRPDL